MKIYNVFKTVIPGLPQLDSLLEELSWEALNELGGPAVGKAVGEGEGEGAFFSTFSRIISISNAKKRGYFPEETKPQTIRGWIKSGEIPKDCVKKIGGKYFLIEHKLLAWLLENEQKFGSDGGEETNVNDSKKGGTEMWTLPQEKTGRCRLSMGANFHLISDPLKDGRESFRLEYRDSENERRYTRLKKSFVKSREQAIAVAEKEIERMVKLGKIYNPFSKEVVVPTAPGDYTIAQISEKFLFAKKKENIRSYNILKTTIKNRIVPFFGNIPMSGLNLRKLKEYRDMRREKVEDVSIKNDLTSLRLMYNWAIDEGIYAGQNPVRIRPINLHIKNRERYMTPAEEEKIWEVLKENPLLKDLADFALNTSMRPQNIVDMEWNRINIEEKTAVVPAGMHKQGFKGNYLLNMTVINLLVKRKKASDSEFVFHFDDGKKVFMKWLQREWKSACEKVGIVGLHFYDLKHTCLSRLAGNGSNVFILKRISNHSSTSSLEKYVKAAGLKEPALEALNGVK